MLVGEKNSTAFWELGPKRIRLGVPAFPRVQLFAVLTVT